MDLHRPFKMDSPSYLPPPLASPALMVLASTAEAGRDASVPCQAPRPFGVPVSMEKDLHLPFPSASYTFTSMYQRQGSIAGAFPSRDFPASLLHLHPQFTPPNLDSTTLSMLNHSGVGAFRPFSSPQEERESGLYQSAFSPAKRLKSCFPEVEGKEFDFGSPAGSLKAGEDSGRKLFSMSGLLSDGEASSSPEERKEHSEYRVTPDSGSTGPNTRNRALNQHIRDFTCLKITFKCSTAVSALGDQNKKIPFGAKIYSNYLSLVVQAAMDTNK